MRGLALLMGSSTYHKPSPWVTQVWGTVSLPAGNPPHWAFQWNTTDDPGLPWDQARIALVNGAQTEGRISRFVNCGDDPSLILDVAQGQTSLTVIKPTGTADTLTYSRYLCTHGCEQHVWYDVTIFGIEAFWPLISGKSVIITLQPDS